MTSHIFDSIIVHAFLDKTLCTVVKKSLTPPHKASFMDYPLVYLIIFVQVINPNKIISGKVQSNSVITNTSGPDKFVRYNRGSL